MAPATAPHAGSADAALDKVFGALSDPTRRSIINQLTSGEATMSEIAAHFDMSLPGVSKHVGVLEDAGLVHRWRSGRTRRCRLQTEVLSDAQEWIAQRTTFWNDTLDQLADYVEGQAVDE